MVLANEKFIVNENGVKVEVILPIDSYENLLRELEELESIKAYDNAKSLDNEVIPFDLAMSEIGL